MANIQLENINKFYGDIHVVKDFNLSIADREFVVFVGTFGVRQVDDAADGRRP